MPFLGSNEFVTAPRASDIHGIKTPAMIALTVPMNIINLSFLFMYLKY